MCGGTSGGGIFASVTRPVISTYAGVTPIRRNAPNPIPFLIRSLLLAWLAALALFVVGPLAGSIDDDGDGNPDVPVVVSALTLVGEVSHVTDVSLGPQNVPEVAGVLIGIHTHYSEDVNSGFASFGGRSVLLSSCLLRC